MATITENFEELIQDLSEEAKRALQRYVNTDDEKSGLIEDYNNYNPPVYSNYKDFECKFNEYYSRDDKDYGGGTPSSVSTIIAYNTAEGKADFYDPQYSIKRTNSDGSTKASYKPINEVIENCNNPKLMFGHMAMYDTNNSFSGELLKDILQADKLKDKKMVVMPLGLAEGENHHTVSLILNPETNEALLIDQGGKDTGYDNAKEKLRGLLRQCGYSITEPDRVMENNMDCAIFAAMVNEVAISKSSLDEITSWLDQFRSKSDDEKRNKVDEKNAEYKKEVLKHYVADYKENPLFKAYLEAKQIDITVKSDKEVLDIINSFAAVDTMNINENMHDDDRPHADPEWAKEVEEAVKRANAKTHNKFERFEDPDHPNYVCFKDSKNENNIIAFAGKSDAYVAGGQAAFDELVAAAQKLGKESIRFGKFEKHPEYKARLYLACLKCGLKPVGDNVPTKEELEASPEYDAIKLEEERIDTIKKYNESKKKRDETLDAWKADPNYESLENAVKEAQAKFDTDSTEENKKELELAKEDRQNNPRYSAYDEARSAHIESSKKMLDLYLDHGLKPFDRTSKEVRKENAKRFVKGIEETNKADRQVERTALKAHLESRNTR
ncbi:MAG: hypothetical protein E7019_00675 [Alphaproteobacteria bacterium]|nr:hypothetical protein [Alphaproteobacteria bacterium]